RLTAGQAGAKTVRAAREVRSEQATGLRRSRSGAAPLHSMADSRIQERRRLRTVSDGFDPVRFAHGAFDEGPRLRFAKSVERVWFSKLRRGRWRVSNHGRATTGSDSDGAGNGCRSGAAKIHQRGSNRGRVAEGKERTRAELPAWSRVESRKSGSTEQWRSVLWRPRLLQHRLSEDACRDCGRRQTCCCAISDAFSHRAECGAEGQEGSGVESN